jgi:hypothetical protein
MRQTRYTSGNAISGVLMQRLNLALAAALCLFSLAPTMRSQSDADVTRAPDRGTSEHIWGIVIPAIPGQPFSARLNVQVTNQLPDGTTVERKFFNILARDSEGRVYKERRRILPADSPEESPLTEFYIYDTPTRTETACIPAQRTCRVSRFVPQTHFGEEPVGLAPDGKSYLTRENLGTTTMNDLDVQYTRETRTFNPGAFGNNRPVAVVKEYWYSPKLEINLAVTRNDPRTSVQKLSLADLSQEEPDPSRFAAPQGYRMVDERVQPGTRPEVVPAEDAGANP